MQNNKTAAEISLALSKLENDVQNTTTNLMELIKDDHDWWLKHLPLLVGQPLNSLKQQLAPLNDRSFEKWDFYKPNHEFMTEMEPLESLVWLAALCRVDRLLVAALPRGFVDALELQWRVLALHWVS